ncbi:MAG TPA: EcsC family protein [Acetobacteraceae bacterium]
MSARGAIAGLIGLPGLSFDLPVTMATMLRSIAGIARSHGEDLTDPDTRRACIEVFTVAGLPRGDADVELSYWAARAALNHATSGLTIQQAARILSIALSEKLLTQTVPIAGAVTGGAASYMFLGYHQRIARLHFCVRQLERQSGDPAAVRAALHETIVDIRNRRNVQA